MWQDKEPRKLKKLKINKGILSKIAQLQQEYGIRIDCKKAYDTYRTQFVCQVVSTNYFFTVSIDERMLVDQFEMVPRLLEHEIRNGMQKYMHKQEETRRKKEKKIAMITNTNQYAGVSNQGLNSTGWTDAYTSITSTTSTAQYGYQQLQQAVEPFKQAVKKAKKKFNNYVDQLRNEVDTPLTDILI